MDRKVAQDLKTSIKRFKKYIAPDLKKEMKGKFEIVEGITVDEIANLLDTLSGIDIWHIDKTKGIRGIANRIQKKNKYWQTFTIRKERESGANTEYEKRKEAIENNYLYPHLTLQGYINKNNDKLFGYAVVRTKDLLEMIEKDKYKTNIAIDNKGWATFYVVYWSDIKKENYPIFIKNIKQEKEIK